jgi:hypothetical protein
MDAIEKLRRLEEELREVRERERKIRNEIEQEVKKTFSYISKGISTVAKSYKITNKTYPLFAFLDISYTSYLNLYFLSRDGLKTMTASGNSSKVRLRDLRRMYFNLLNGEYKIYVKNKQITPIEFYVNLSQTIANASLSGFDLQETISILSYALRKSEIYYYAPEWLAREHERSVRLILSRINKKAEIVAERIPIIWYSHD